MKKWVYLFREGDASMRVLLGGKGAGVAEMTKAGMPVPPGFTITTEACNATLANGGQFPDGMWDQVMTALHEVEGQAGKRFGDPENPLLVSVRSGAQFSMPGMMDTVLNLGLNEQTLQGLAKLTDNERFAQDAYRRFVQLFGRIVLNVTGEKLEHVMDEAKEHYSKDGQPGQDTDLSAEDLARIAQQFKDIIKQETGHDFPEDPFEQLRTAIQAVFSSWNGKRAIDYRRLNKIADDLGTAVNVQTMVFGNMGDDSATGVAFTRSPSTGEKALYGEYLVNAQGEDVVAGIRTPQPISEMAKEMPDSYREFQDIATRLEQHYKDVQDMEFTIERGKLFMLQTRSGKRTGAAAVKTAVDMVNEGVIDKATAIKRVDPSQLDQLLHPMIDPSDKVEVLATGLPASPGAAVGAVVFDPNVAEEEANKGKKVILVRIETAPEDFHGMVAAQAILTARGGMTSHAAVVARGMGKTCVAGCSALSIDYGAHQFTANGVVIKEGDYITLDGTTGRVIKGSARLIAPELSGDFGTFMDWVDEFRTMGVRANADIPRDAQAARRFGAEGIGLCRTEHMFFEGNRIDAVREMIVANNLDERKQALAKIEPLQKEDFIGLFTAMEGLPVIIRTLDPPLHEFLPHTDAEIADLAHKMNIETDRLRATVENLREANPMLGLRGCRLGIVYPEITEMQARAIFTAAAECKQKGVDAHPEVMIPLVGNVNELKAQAEIVRRVASEVEQHTGVKLDYLVGTMIELPRAALTADKIAEVAEFFSFGTNDLTQTTLGLSRDDAGRFLPAYVEKKIFKDDPFQTLDQDGVGQLVRMGTERGRMTRPDLEVGICGEHGGDPASVMFCYSVGMNYVSCSPYRVPIARLAAAQAALGDARRDK